MQKVEVFFDLTCPYCYRGLGSLKELMPRYPGVKILWKPVEAHPKIEEPEHKPYADLTVQGCLFVDDSGGDTLKFIDNVYHAYFEEKKAPDDIAVLAKCAEGCDVDVPAFTEALKKRTLENAGHESNDYAYEKQGVWAVPTFVSPADCNGSGKEKRLDAVGGVGVTKEQLDTLLKSL